MSECPHCGALDVQIPMRAWNNANTYQKTVVTVTECCGYAVDLTPIRSWRVSAHVSDREEDDWCERIKLHTFHDVLVNWDAPIVIAETPWQQELPARLVKEANGYCLVEVEAEHRVRRKSPSSMSGARWTFKKDGQFSGGSGAIRVINKRPTT